MLIKKLFLLLSLGFLISSLIILVNTPTKTAKVTDVIEETTTTEITTTSVTTTIKETTTTTITTTTTSIEPGDPLCEDLGCPYGTKFVGSKNSDRYHYCDCQWAKRIKPENIVCFFSKEQAEDEGYYLCSGRKTETTSTTTIITTSTTTSTTVDTIISSETTTTSTSVISTTIIESIDCVDLGCPEDTQFVGSKNSNKYHYCSCTWAKKIKLENIKCFPTKEDARSNGYIPCKTCEPPE